MRRIALVILLAGVIEFVVFAQNTPEPKIRNPVGVYLEIVSFLVNGQETKNSYASEALFMIERRTGEVIWVIFSKKDGGDEGFLLSDLDPLFGTYGSVRYNNTTIPDAVAEATVGGRIVFGVITVGDITEIMINKGEKTIYKILLRVSA
jgi:hypothetical protein